jgi:hypothetical protein
MKKVSKFVLMLCFVLSAALSYAHSATRTENKKGEGITIEVKEKTCHGGLDERLFYEYHDRSTTFFHKLTIQYGYLHNGKPITND